MLKTSTPFLFSFLFSLSLFSQLHDNVWLTGVRGPYNQPSLDENSKIIFDNHPPEIAYTENFGGHRQCGTSMSDAEGNLLFYTNCQQIANFEDQLMENGDSINFDHEISSIRYGEGSWVVNGAIALPDPSNENQYYLFHVNVGDYDYYSNKTYSIGTHLLCSKIDMSLNGGAGAVIEKNTIILEDRILPGALSAARHANGRDWWLIVFKYGEPGYYRILIGKNGVSNLGLKDTDVSIGQGFPNGGASVFTPDGSKLAIIASDPGYDSPQSLFIFDFDRCDGTLSNSKEVSYAEQTYNLVLDLAYNFSYGCTISPNSRYLYVSNRYTYYQIDLWSENPQEAIVTVANEDGWFHGGPNQGWWYGLFGYSGLGRDGRIYATTVGFSDRFHVIEQPNEPGVGCKVEQHSFKLNGINWYTVPNHPNYRFGPLEGSPCDTLGVEKAIYIHAHPYPEEGCVGGIAHFEVTAFGTEKSYQWQVSPDGGEAWDNLENGTDYTGVHSEYLIVRDIMEQMDGYQFKCKVAGNVSTEHSRPATLTVLGARPIAAIEIEQNIDSLYFYDLSEGNEHAKWFFGTGDSSVQAGARYLYRGAGTFTVALVASNACGEDTAYQEVIIEPLFADFEIERRIGCAPFTTVITSLSPFRSTPMEFSVQTGELWDWWVRSDHLRSYHTLDFETPGVYDASHKVWGDGTTAEITKENYITVLTGINPDAEIELAQDGYNIQLNAPFDFADSYIWHFENGDSLSGQMAEYGFSEPGVYQVQLEATNHCGTDVGSIEVFVGELEAAFSASARSGCAPFTVEYGYETEFENADFVWHLPGTPPGIFEVKNPEVTYAEPGLYDVTLIVWAGGFWAGGLKDTLTFEDYIEVLEDNCPQLELTVDVDGLTAAASANCPGSYSFEWDMGDGNILDNEGQVVHQYQSAGTYGVSLIVEGQCGLDTASVTIIVEEPLGLNNLLLLDEIELVPNPASGEVQVVSKKIFPAGANFQLFNTLGVVVFKNKKNVWEKREKVSLEGLSSGVYFYRFESAGGRSQVGKLVVER